MTIISRCGADGVTGRLLDDYLELDGRGPGARATELTISGDGQGTPGSFHIWFEKRQVDISGLLECDAHRQIGGREVRQRE